MSPQPPKWADRFLEWYCNPDLLEDLQGDLYEEFDSMVHHGQPFKAKLYYFWLVLRSFRYSVLKRNSNLKSTTVMMTKSNLTIAFRVLKNNRFYTILNITGLAVGIMCFFLTGFYVKQELSYDQFNTKKDRIYRVWLKEIYSEDKIFFSSTTPLIFETFLEDNFGEVESAIQVDGNNYLVGSGADRINENLAVVSPEIFSVFDFNILKGDQENPLNGKRNVILSEAYAQKYFGDELTIGQSLPIEINGEVQDFIVTAVFSEIPQESSIRFDMAISNENNSDLYGKQRLTNWFSISPETYVLIKENSTITTIEEAIPEVIMSLIGEQVNEGEYNIGFQPLTDIHLNTDIPVGRAPVGNPNYVTILGAISILVLLTACINYTTLTIGQSLKRSKEVGVRKAMGAGRSSLVNQYLSESFIVIILALSLSVFLTYVALPVFNELTDANVILGFEPWHLLLYLVLIVIIGISSGIYPALILSKLKATDIFKGTQTLSNKRYIQNGMVIFQFVITVFLISSTLIMQRQLDFMQSKDMGFSYDAVVSVPLYNDPSSQSLADDIASAMEKGAQLKEKLGLYSDINNLGMGSHIFGNSGWTKLAYTDNTEVFRRFRMLVADPGYFSTFDIQMKEGRAFEPSSELDLKKSIILNESAVALFGLDDPIGKQLPGNDFGDHQIIGVTNDFNFSSLHHAIEPLVITQNVQPIVDGVSDYNFQDSPIPKLVFRYSGSQLSKVKEILDAEWKTIYPDKELEFSFVEENMKAQYASESKMNRLLGVATILSIIIASLGLVGLTVLVVRSKEKEIGIRKVIGASEASIFRLLMNKFSGQLLLGILLSIPVTYWLMNDWLSDFAYRINLTFDLFLLGGIISIVVALLAIGFHTLKAALINPIKTLRSE